MRQDGRAFDQLRKTVITPHYIKNAEGSVMIEVGDTRVICTASLEEKVPIFLKNTGQGWLTSEYGMLPRSTSSRVSREATQGRQSGRTQEIQRLVGRALRAVTNLHALGERTIWIDCDVIQADGGTRTASITGGFAALVLACSGLIEQRLLNQFPVRDYVAAVSVGIVNQRPLLDLNYHEDSRADVDMNIVSTGQGHYVEIQGTAEKRPFVSSDLQEMLRLAEKGIRELIQAQKKMFHHAIEERFWSLLPPLED